MLKKQNFNVNYGDLKYKLFERKKHKLEEKNKNVCRTYLPDLCIDEFEFIELLSLV